MIHRVYLDKRKGRLRPAFAFGRRGIALGSQLGGIF
jgi:hypothetical protein